MPRRFSVLIGTLFCGENELDDCIRSIQSQAGIAIDHFVIKNRPKQEAHRELYRRFEQAKNNYDYFVKLDADMCFTRSTALQELVESIEEDVDIASYSVYDFFTGGPIQSLNIFSKRCQFSFDENDGLFTDQLPIRFPGRQTYRVDDSDPAVLHAFNPTAFQSFAFGVHRALKIVQSGRGLRIQNAFWQHQILRHTYRNYVSGQDDRLRLALAGASAVFDRKVVAPDVYTKEAFRVAYSHYENWQIRLRDRVRFWPSWIALLTILPPSRVVTGLVAYIRNATSKRIHRP